LFAAALFASASALYESLIEINDSNYRDLVLDDEENMWVITYYADWCPYSRALEHEVVVNSRNMQVAGYNVKYGAVNVEYSPEMVHRYQVNRAPLMYIYGVDKKNPDRYGGIRTHEALDAYVEEECTYFGYDKDVHETGYIQKQEYDVEALEADLDQAQADRLEFYAETYDQSMDKESNQYSMTVQSLMEAYEKQAQEIYAMRDEAIKNEDVRHADAMEGYTMVYEDKVEEAVHEHTQVVKNMKSAYLKDLGLEVYFKTIDDKPYLANIEPASYAKTVKVAADSCECEYGYDCGCDAHYDEECGCDGHYDCGCDDHHHDDYDYGYGYGYDDYALGPHEHQYVEYQMDPYAYGPYGGYPMPSSGYDAVAAQYNGYQQYAEPVYGHQYRNGPYYY